MVKNRKGWMEVVESFLSVAVLVALLTILISEGNVEEDFDSKIYQKEVVLLQSIELNDSFRQEILNIASGDLPVLLEDGDFPLSIKENINTSRPSYLNCSAKICDIDDSCLPEENLEVNIYSRSIGIFANNLEYNPRQLKLFCWEEGDLNIRTNLNRCEDSDGGKNYLQKGDTTNSSSSGEDSCSGNILTEYFCEGKKVSSEAYTCLEECSDGACVEESAEGDEGFAYYNSGGNKVASFKYNGDIIILGSCNSGGSCSSAPVDSFTIINGGAIVSYIDGNGNLCVSSGDCSSSANCDSPTGDAFTIKNSEGDTVIYIDSTGDLCFTGTLEQGGTP